MGRKKKERKASSSESDSPSSKEEESSSSGSESKEEEASVSAATAPVRSPKRRKKQGVEKQREVRQDRSIERSRWESPDSRKRRHSPGVQNQQKRRGHRERQDGTKWEKNDREKDIERDSDKRKKEDNHRVKNERRDPPERDAHNQHRNHERSPQQQQHQHQHQHQHPQQRNENRENRPNDRFEGRKSPRREDRNKRFDERDNRNRNNNDRGRRGGRGNRFGNDGPRSRFDGSRVKNEPSPEWGRPEVKDEGDGKPVEKEKPNFEPSGKLTEDANTVNGVVIKYTEPLESRKPKRRWRLYPFKGEKALPTLYVHRQSAFLMGRDRKVADIPLDHPSCSKQHAALQFRLVSFERGDGGEGKRVRPYLIDLESANGTFVNDVKLEARRYHELLERDVLKFGFSSREYVLLHEQSKDDALDDDVPSPTVAQK